jgi:hypothetical protein
VSYVKLALQVGTVTDFSGVVLSQVKLNVNGGVVGAGEQAEVV